MSIELIAVVVGAAMAVISVAGAGFAWWRSNLSKGAKAAAEASQATAEQQVCAARGQARAAQESADAAREEVAHLEQLVTALEAQGRELARIAEAASPEPFKITRTGPGRFIIRNQMKRDAVILGIDNFIDGLDFPTPVDIDAGQAVEFSISRRGSVKLPPPVMVLDVMGENGPVYVDLPPR